MINQHFFETKEQLYQQTTAFCAEILAKGVQQNGHASFIVPGGTTPAPIFELLSKTTLDWKKITVAPSDERWLEVQHDKSNEYLIKQKLLQNNARHAQFVGMKSAHDTALQAQQTCSRQYGKIVQPYDIVMLGMGPDGHFASLFPNADPIIKALDPENTQNCIAMDATDCAVAGEFTQRMSMTLAAFLKSKHIILLFTGEQKLAIYKSAKQLNDQSILPVCALIHQNQVPVELFWAP